MKKYKMMALTGILLSSAILGANTSVVQAANTNALNVDTSEVANNVIQVINDLLNSSTTANKVGSQTQFSDLENGSEKMVAPIFGEKTNAAFSKTLQGELNVVDTNGQLVPMTVTDRDDHGFAKEVSYTLDGTTKTISVGYNYARPTVSFNNNRTMNFKDGDKNIDAVSSNISSVNVNTLNGADANGVANKTAVTASKTGNTVTFTPSDSYVNSGISADRTVNVYTEPDWSQLNNTDKTRTVSSVSDLDNPSVIVNKSNGQMYLVKASYTKPEDADATSVSVTYTATAIDSKGNTINDAETTSPITYTKDSEVTIDSSNIYPTVTYKDENGNVVYTKTFDPIANTATTTISSAKIQSELPTGYTLSFPSEFAASKKDSTKSYTVYKAAATAVKYINVMNGNTVGTTNLSGKEGSNTVLEGIPANYQLVTKTDLIQTLDSNQSSKDIYVKPITNPINTLSYTVTFKDLSTGNVIGSEVNGTGNFGKYVSLTAPDGYSFATIADNGFLLLKNNQQVTKYVKAANTPYNISYVDQDTNKEVGTQSGKGADGSKVTLKAPTDYAFVNADDMTYTIDKDDTSTKTIYVQKSDQTADNIVAGYPKNGYIKIYNASGKLNNDVVLSEGSSWIIDKTLTINGAEYYRVATNEYVKASDVYKYTPLQSIVTTKGVNVTPVYNSKGQLVIDLALDTNTPWYTDRSANIKGSEMYRVATDQWVKASDVTLNK